MTRSKKIKPFYVFTWFNGCFEPYDVMPHLIDRYKKSKKKKPLETREDVLKFIKSESMYQWWARCEYEIILSDWPCMTEQRKIDVHEQLMMNLDVAADLFISNLKLKVLEKERK